MSSVAVVALGKIGLPLAVAIAEGGHTVIGCDIDPGVVDLVNAGTPPFPNEAELDERLARAVSSGRLTSVIVSPLSSMAARIRTFSSSRTLPGQS